MSQADKDVATLQQYIDRKFAGCDQNRLYVAVTCAQQILELVRSNQIKKANRN